MDAVAISGRFEELPALLRQRFSDGLVDRVSLYTAVETQPDVAAWARFNAAVRGP
jgi:hypothetical protein